MTKVAIYGQFKRNFPKEIVSLVIAKLKNLEIEIYIEHEC